jgi:hypothetical protein
LGPRDRSFPGVPWSEATLMEFMRLWRWDRGTSVRGMGGRGSSPSRGAIQILRLVPPIGRLCRRS